MKVRNILIIIVLLVGCSFKCLPGRKMSFIDLFFRDVEVMEQTTGRLGRSLKKILRRYVNVRSSAYRNVWTDIMKMEESDRMFIKLKFLNIVQRLKEDDDLSRGQS